MKKLNSKPIKLERLSVNTEQKDNLELLSGQSILLRNTFTASSDAITTLMDQAKQNALEYLNRRKLGQKLGIFEENNLHKALLEIQQKLEVPNFPHRVECYDISHLQGKFVYGSMVVFQEGKPAKKLYRLFKTKEQNNDYENLSEVIRRRLERYLRHELDEVNLWRLPELIVIDGGKGQLSAVMEVINAYLQKPEFLALKTVRVCALAKKEELIYVPETMTEIRFVGLPKFMLQRLRDETHRFGIKNNRNARAKMASTTVLSEIEGIGPVTANKLLKEFGSTQNIIDTLWDNYTYMIEFAGERNTVKLAVYFGVRKT